MVCVIVKKLLSEFIESFLERKRLHSLFVFYKTHHYEHNNKKDKQSKFEHRVGLGARRRAPASLQ